MHRYIFEGLDRAGLFGIDVEVQNLRAVGLDIHIAATISVPRFDLHAVEVVDYSDDARVADLVTRAGGREVTA